MWRTKQAKAQNATAIPMGIPRPPVQPQTVHNHAPSEAGKTFSKLVAGLIVFFVGWQFLVYLVQEMGYRKPVATLGWALFGLVGLTVITYALNHILLVIKDTLVQITEIKESARIETARLSTIQAAQPRLGESRLTDEDSKFCALLRIVMDEAYRHIYRDPQEVQQYTKGEVKPWSRTPNQGRVIPGVKGEVSFAMAGNVRGWLGKEGVINGRDEINLERYPTFKHFERLLEQRYYTPVQVVSSSPALRQEVNFIENT